MIIEAPTPNKKIFIFHNVDHICGKISGSFILKCAQDVEAYIENVDGSSCPSSLLIYGQ